ncbi:3-deoxy-manno-octulosonate cytidylyltransferase [Fuerstiella marisgermanici]|uniref:3-deoxy-manno-octulosonate cytidylyltransferase n=1 Tax=Fuerstiella marisgermanici TaxID=1891926 RepID=A0A1P8WDT1_9PLAN|nr:3-deoxy-manno-octulosonate cytidylyltransferase [Fuerstiella marisgermanici]APZ92189.1 3-deoxy-manno-octulosonate cytidylyltransferase [Fuerstiella marisgermanici]
MRTVGIIPARLQSSRLPEKLLLNETGRPLIEYVWQVAQQCTALDEVIVATDSPRIQEAVTSFGGRAELTGEFPSGSDRVADIARRCCPDADVIVNLQGDEPELEVATIDSLVTTLRESGAEMATVAAPLSDVDAIQSPDCVKVVVSDNGNALYFSRSVIPFPRGTSVADTLKAATATPWLLHVGLYAYRHDFLLRLTSMEPSTLEELEKLEQLRALQTGASIAVTVIPEAAVGIDTPEDYAAFVKRETSRSR